MFYKRGAFGLAIGLIVLVLLIIGAVFYFSGSKTDTSSISIPSSDTGEISVPPTIPESSTPPAPSTSQTLEVKIKDFKFVPADITVKVGDTIKWTNEDTAPHTATASDNTFDTGRLTKGESGSHTFTNANIGAHPYICSIHPSMKGTVTVTA